MDATPGNPQAHERIAWHRLVHGLDVQPRLDTDGFHALTPTSSTNTRLVADPFAAGADPAAAEQARNDPPRPLLVLSTSVIMRSRLPRTCRFISTTRSCPAAWAVSMRVSVRCRCSRSSGKNRWAFFMAVASVRACAQRS
jgi:hypothetical protein